jgi:beta-N-acetylhexosaminidase
MSLHAPLILDIAGTELNADDRRRLQHPLTGGLIFFTRNFRDRRQITEVAAECKALRPDLLVSVDHEGGRVQRFRLDGFTHLPAMSAFGALWMRDAMRALDAATCAGYVLGAELRACGVDLSWTPVLDLDHGRSSAIGNRAFHRDARVVTVLAQGLVTGLLRVGMNNCAKHFPGHGYAEADTHHGGAVDDRTLEEILGDDARPYDWLSAAVTCVIPAHVTYPRVDDRPAGFSPRWLKEVLRGQLGYTGAVCTDDLAMEGARQAGSALEGCIAALNAGCDLVMLCNQSKVDGGRPLDEVLDGLDAALEHGRWQADAESEARRLDLLPQTAPMPWDDLMHHAPYRHALERLP